MTLNEIRIYLNALLNKESFGGDLNLKEFNYLIQDENLNFFKEKVEECYNTQRNGLLVPDLVYSSKILRPFITESTVAPAAGVVNLSSGLTTYAYFISCRTTSALNGQVRDIPLVTHDALNNMMTNLLSKPIKKNPVATIDGDNLRIKPTNISSVIITYLKYPTTPVFDYYIDADDMEVYLAAGGSRLLTTGETGSAGQTSGTNVSSLTVELQWKSEFHPEFVQRLCRKLGIPQRDQILLQQGMVDKQEQEAK